MIWSSPINTDDYEFLIKYNNRSNIRTQLVQYARYLSIDDFTMSSSMDPLKSNNVTVATKIGLVTSASINCSSNTISSETTASPNPSPAPTNPTPSPTIYYNVSFLVHDKHITHSKKKEKYISNSFYVQIKGNAHEWTPWNNITLLGENIDNRSKIAYGNYGANQNSNNDQSYVYYNNSVYIWYTFDLFTENVGSTNKMRLLTYHTNDLLFECFNVTQTSGSVSFCDSQSSGISISYEKTEDTDGGCYWVEIFFIDDDYEDYNNTGTCLFEASDSGGDQHGNSQTDLTQFDITATFVTVGMFIFAIMILVFGKMYHRFVKNDTISNPPNYKSIIGFFICLFDFWTDLAALVVYFYYQEENELIFIFGCIFTFVPAIASWIIAIYTIDNWRNANDTSANNVQIWLNKYNKVSYLVTITSTFYGAVDLSTSKIFSFKYFDLPLSKLDYIHLLQYRFLNMTVFKNLPQLVIQLYYINLFVNESVFNHPIIMLSIIFTLLSMLLSVVSQVSRVCYDQRMSIQRMNTYTKSEEYIEPLVMGSQLVFHNNNNVQLMDSTDIHASVNSGISGISDVLGPFIVKKALIVFLGIGDYDDELQNLPGVLKDYQNILNTFVETWKYHALYKIQDNNQTIYSNAIETIKSHHNKFKLHWIEDEIDQFVEEARKHVVMNQHDGLIFCISSHGDTGKIIYDSNMDECDLHDIFKLFQAEWRTQLETYTETKEMSKQLFQIPKIFCIDSCRGSVEATIENVTQIDNDGENHNSKDENKSDETVAIKYKGTGRNNINKSKTKISKPEQLNLKTITKSQAQSLSNDYSNFCKLWANVEGFAVADGSTNGGLFLRNVSTIFGDKKFVLNNGWTQIMFKIREYTKREATLFGNLANFTQIVENEGTLERPVKFQIGKASG